MKEQPKQLACIVVKEEPNNYLYKVHSSTKQVFYALRCIDYKKALSKQKAKKPNIIDDCNSYEWSNWKGYALVVWEVVKEWQLKLIETLKGFE